MGYDNEEDRDYWNEAKDCIYGSNYLKEAEECLKEKGWSESEIYDDKDPVGSLVIDYYDEEYCEKFPEKCHE